MSVYQTTQIYKSLENAVAGMVQEGLGEDIKKEILQAFDQYMISSMPQAELARVKLEAPMINSYRLFDSTVVMDVPQVVIKESDGQSFEAGRITIACEKLVKPRNGSANSQRKECKKGPKGSKLSKKR